jgi:hypothetical protein
MICILRDQHMRQKTWPGESPVYRSRRRRCFDHHIASCIGPHVADDLEAGQNVRQHFRDILAQLAKPAATLPTGVFSGEMHMHFRGRCSGSGRSCQLVRAVLLVATASARSACRVSNSSSFNSNCSISRATFSLFVPNIMRRSLTSMRDPHQAAVKGNRCARKLRMRHSAIP